jgi:uncharacterized protein (TIGR04255 family)
MSNINFDNTPKFSKPPIVETVLGVQFAPLRNFRITHFGAFQTLLEGRFPLVQQHPRLEHRIEEEVEHFAAFPSIQLFMPPIPRVWYITPEGTQGQHLIQLQDDRLILNWRKGVPGNDDYASYKRNRKEFAETFGKFVKFTQENALGELAVDQCEVIYVNQIPISEFSGIFDAYQECLKITMVQPLTAMEEGRFDNIGFSQSLWIDSLKGRLIIEADMLSTEGGAHAIGLRITVRGTPEGNSSEKVLEWLDRGHYQVVKTFADITSEKMHQKWERTK